MKNLRGSEYFPYPLYIYIYYVYNIIILKVIRFNFLTFVNVLDVGSDNISNDLALTNNEQQFLQHLSKSVLLIARLASLMRLARFTLWLAWQQIIRYYHHAVNPDIS